MSGYQVGSIELLEKLEMDISYDLNELAKKAGPSGKRLAEQIFDKLGIIHDGYSSKWANMTKTDQEFHGGK